MRRLPLPQLRPETKIQLDRIITAWDEALAAQNGDFLFGKFSIANCLYAPMVSRFTTYDVAVPPRVKAYMEKIWALPGMQNWLEASQKEVAEGIAVAPGGFAVETRRAGMQRRGRRQRAPVARPISRAEGWLAASAS